MRTTNQRRPAVFLSLAAVLMASSAAPIKAQPSAQQAPPRVTMAIFSDRSFQGESWSNLVAALHRELASTAPETQALVKEIFDRKTLSATDLEILSGDQIFPGRETGSPIIVYLHGDCAAIPHPDLSSPVRLGQPTVTGALGWVQSDHGEIKPFLHVECDRISQLLASTATRNTSQRGALMSTAISRVILHEWIHIANQTQRHARSGLAKAQFGVNDLTAQPPAESNRTTLQDRGR